MTYSPRAELAFPGGRLERAVNEKLLADSIPDSRGAVFSAHSTLPSGLADILPYIEISAERPSKRILEKISDIPGWGMRVP